MHVQKNIKRTMELIEKLQNEKTLPLLEIRELETAIRELPGKEAGHLMDQFAVFCKLNVKEDTKEVMEIVLGFIRNNRLSYWLQDMKHSVAGACQIVAEEMIAFSDATGLNPYAMKV